MMQPYAMENWPSRGVLRDLFRYCSKVPESWKPQRCFR
jgi:hypothetical protein